MRTLLRQNHRQKLKAGGDFFPKMRPVGSEARVLKYGVSEIKSLIETLRPREKIDPYTLSPENLRRVAATASLIPKASRSAARLIDIGGTVYWIPIYAKLLGYDHVTILERPGGGFFNNFQIPGQGEDFLADTIEADAELDIYPIASGTVECVTCFHLLEHLAGDPMHVIAESNRVLKTDGHMCMTTPNVLYYPNLVRFLFGGHPFGWSVYTDSYADRHNREYTPSEVQELFEAGGFSMELLRTHTWKAERNPKIKVVGYALCALAALTGRVSFKLRGSEIGIRARKVAEVVERFPGFLYDLFGASEVQVKIGKPARFGSVSGSHIV